MSALWNAFIRGDWPYGTTLRPRYAANLSSPANPLKDLSPHPSLDIPDICSVIQDLCDGRRTVGEIYGEVFRRYAGRVPKLLTTFTKNMLRLYETGSLELEIDDCMVREESQVLDLKNMTFYIINCGNHARKRQFMEGQLQEQQLLFEFVPGVECTPSHVGIALSHLKILQRRDISVPFVIVEDDCQFMDSFQSVLKIPEMVDALYLGVSLFGLSAPGEFSWGVWNNTQYGQYSDHYLRVFNMLSSHGIVYLTERFRQGAINACLQALTDLEKPYPMDIGLALLQTSHVVLTPNEPFCYQSEHYHGNHEATKYSLRCASSLIFT